MSDSPLSYTVLSDFDSVKEIAPAWRALHMVVGGGMFSDYDWFAAWWETLGCHEGCRLNILIARRGVHLVGILPLVVRKRSGFRILEWAGNELLDYCEALGQNAEIVASLWQQAKASKTYDVGAVRDVLDGSVDCKILQTFSHRLERNEAPYLALTWASYEEWRKGQTRNYRHKMNGFMRKLEKKGELRFDVYRNAFEAKDHIDAMVRLKIDWCASHEKSGVFMRDSIQAVFHRLTEIASSKDQLFLTTLKCGESEIAYFFGFVKDGVLYCYCSAFDPDWADYSPGILLFDHCLCWCITNGVKECDHMRGAEAYKSRFASGSRALPTFLFARGVRGLLGLWLYRLHFALKEKRV